jgi:hypothetical protein
MRIGGGGGVERLIRCYFLILNLLLTHVEEEIVKLLQQRVSIMHCCEIAKLRFGF